MSVSDSQIYEFPSEENAAKSLYVHVPFCFHRCGYCDFTLVSGRDDLIPEYLEALRNELATLTQKGRLDTVFIGGGTPTHLNPDQLADLLQLIHQHFDLSPDVEFTVEANPEGLLAEQMAVLAAHGVNRLSLGVQSFDDTILSTLERQHRSDQAAAVIQQAERFFSSVSLDLIFGVPGQTEELWQQTLTTALSLPVNHLSTYGLTFEKGTSFFQRRATGTLNPLSDEVERRMYAHAIDRSGAAGFEHYEISSFARPGHRCRHNINYWNSSGYFAFGPGAARYINGIRSTNARSVTRWVKSWLKGQPALQDVEKLSADAKIREAIFLALRQIDGISIADFDRRWDIDLLRDFAPAIDDNIAKGLLTVSDGRVQLTSEGIFFADNVSADFL